jgi:hypothetical protein
MLSILSQIHGSFVLLLYDTIRRRRARGGGRRAARARALRAARAAGILFPRTLIFCALILFPRTGGARGYIVRAEAAGAYLAASLRVRYGLFPLALRGGGLPLLRGRRYRFYDKQRFQRIEVWGKGRRGDQRHCCDPCCALGRCGRWWWRRAATLTAHLPLWDSTHAEPYNFPRGARGDLTRLTNVHRLPIRVDTRWAWSRHLAPAEPDRRRALHLLAPRTQPSKRQQQQQQQHQQQQWRWL